MIVTRVVIFIGGNVPIFGGLLFRSGEWHLKNRGFRKILVRSRNLGGFCVMSQSLVCQVFCLEVSNFFPQRLGVSDTFVEHLEIPEFCLNKLIFI